MKVNGLGSLRITLSFQIIVLLLALAFDAHSSLPQKRILVLYAEDKGLPAHELVDKAIRSAVKSNQTFAIELFTEYMNLSRFKEPRYRETLAGFLGDKYWGTRPDLIITVSGPALDFILKYGDPVFGGIPVVTCTVFENQVRALEQAGFGRRVTGVSFKADIDDIITAARTLKPGTRRIAVVGGASESDQLYLANIHEALRHYEPELEVMELAGLAMPEILARVSSLPPQSIVLYSTIFVDGAGQPFLPREALSMVSRAANAPVFGPFDSYLGFGIVGGRLLSFEAEGKKAMELALRILGGESPADIPITNEDTHVLLFDWRELKRWGISEKALPPGSIVKFKPPSIWEEHQGTILGGIFFMTIETLLIVGLFVNLHKRRRAEDAIRKSEAKYRSLHESMMDGFASVSPDGTIREYNDAYREMTGYAPEELMRLTYRDITPEKWHDYEREIVEQQVLARGYSEVYEKEYRKKDGSIFPVELRTFLLKDEAGGNSGMWAIVRDITDRKRAEMALRASEERFRQVAENVGDFIWEVDANGLYRYTSPSVEKILGYRPDELIGKRHFYDLFAPKVREELKAAAFKVFAAKQSFRAFPNPNVSKEGKIVHLETSGVPVLDAAGSLVGYRGSDTDVTERQEMENKIKKAAEEWQATFDSSQDLIFILDRDFKAVRVNAATLSFFKLPIERILGNPCYLLMHGTDEPPEICPFTAMMKTKRHEETEFYDQERNAWFQVSVDPILDGHGEIAGVVHRVQDITKRKEADETVRKSQEDYRELAGRLLTAQETERRRLARELHDDLSQRLAALAIETGFLERDSPSISKAAAATVQEIREGLVNLSGNVHDISRRLHPSILEDLGLADAIRSECDGLARREKIEVHFDSIDCPPHTPIDISLCLYRVIQESLRNIVKHARATQIHVSLTGGKDMIHLLVKDNGRGFNPIGVPREPGLGLISMRERVRLIQGEISIRSQPGQGTVIEIKAPLKEVTEDLDVGSEEFL